MIYVFDTSSLRELQHFYPAIFQSIWPRLNDLVNAGDLVSTSEVYRELQAQNVSSDVLNWCSSNRQIFAVPTQQEQQFVTTIFAVAHFQALISKQAQLRGTPVADPFVIARAKCLGGTVVSEERAKPNAAKIPNVCQHFGIPCVNLEGFMSAQGWSF